MNEPPIQKSISRIRALLLDVDGVLTDGKIIVHADGSESKHFHVRDGHGIKMAQRAGLKIAFLTGRTSSVVEHRARELGVEFVRQGALQKLPVFQELIKEMGVEASEVAVMGDDVIDLPLFRVAGFSATVADADPQVLEAAQFVSKFPGGGGAVREVIEHLLKAQGKWEGLMERYFG